MDTSVCHSEEERFQEAWEVFSQLVTTSEEHSTREEFLRMFSLKTALPSQESDDGGDGDQDDVCWGRLGYKEDPPKWFDELRTLIMWVIDEMMMFTEHEKVLAVRIAEFIFMYIDERADPTMYDDLGQDYPSEEKLEDSCSHAVEASKGLDMPTIVEKVSSVIAPWIAGDIYCKYVDNAVGRLIWEASHNGDHSDEEDADEDFEDNDEEDFEDNDEEDPDEEDGFEGTDYTHGMSMGTVNAMSSGG
mgnify:CR=1 FL=1